MRKKRRRHRKKSESVRTSRKKKRVAKIKSKKRVLCQCERREILRLLSEKVSISDVARRFACDPKTVRNVRDSKGAPPKPSGPRRVSSPQAALIARRRARVKKLMAKQVKRGRAHEYRSTRVLTAEEIRRALPAPLRPRSTATVRLDLKHLGFKSYVRPKRPKNSPFDRKRRHAFSAKELALGSAIISRTMFSDEKIFDTNDHGQVKMYAKSRSGVWPRMREKWCPKVHVWGAIGPNFRYISFFPKGEKVDRSLYVKHIGPAITQAVRRKLRFMQDGARAHTAKDTMLYLAGRGVNVVSEWPARSPDLNPIENMWSMMERRVSELAPRSEDELVQAVDRAWKAIPVAQMNKLVASYAARLVWCKEHDGGYALGP